MQPQVPRTNVLNVLKVITKINENNKIASNAPREDTVINKDSLSVICVVMLPIPYLEITSQRCRIKIN